jgi:hypothetical protein
LADETAQRGFWSYALRGCGRSPALEPPFSAGAAAVGLAGGAIYRDCRDLIQGPYPQEYFLPDAGFGAAIETVVDDRVGTIDCGTSHASDTRTSGHAGCR